MRRNRNVKVWLVAATVAAISLGVSSCSSDSGGSDPKSDETVTAKQDSALKDQVPDAIVEKGYFSMATDATIGEPWAYKDEASGDLAGLDLDIANAIGDKIGIPMKSDNVPFANLIPGIQSGRYDLSVSVAFDTQEREKVVDIVNFIHGGSGFIVKKDSPNTDLALDDSICGLKIGALAGGIEIDDLKKTSTENCAADKQVDVLSFPTQSDGILAVQSGRIDAYDGDSLQNAYIESKQPNLVASGEPYGVVNIGMLVGKDSGVAPLMQKALQELIDDGTYREILDEWGVSIGALDTVTMNAATE